MLTIWPSGAGRVGSRGVGRCRARPSPRTRRALATFPAGSPGGGALYGRACGESGFELASFWAAARWRPQAPSVLPSQRARRIERDPPRELAGCWRLSPRARRVVALYGEPAGRAARSRRAAGRVARSTASLRGGRCRHGGPAGGESRDHGEHGVAAAPIGGPVWVVVCHLPYEAPAVGVVGPRWWSDRSVLGAATTDLVVAQHGGSAWVRRGHCRAGKAVRAGLREGLLRPAGALK
jgi:hypothetical protein